MGHYTTPMYSYAGYGYDGLSFVGNIAHLVITVLLWVFVIAMIYRLLGWVLDLVSSRQPIAIYKSSMATGATRILYERYARGDITREELQQMKRDMTGI
ncbi:SHOCT domain-containing protein [Sporomusa acidovorans]|uniref:SHOCT domain-containing protein n=1 Tax=Sporomusa acidovorans TaxID=112900 RepID=UPI0008804A68|nr:SHOCT domain-containing protein [Sporomusa acidovorans]OZC19087.1 hypothetical protein SPACI_31730 [Sporomusa acidovorans DSM 3132]SDD66800.1 putative membrane protein [Sporomusa acidovorans]